MSRQNKLQTIGLEQHIDEHCAKKGIRVNYGAFAEMVDAGASTASMARTFKVNYRTMLKWVAAYEQAQVKDGNI